MPNRSISRRSVLLQLISAGVAAPILPKAWGAGSALSFSEGKMSIRSSNEELVRGFEWAKHQALSYVHDSGDPVGPWYEAALPGRNAFCMRDVSHMSVGAHLLGLSVHNHNMLRRFAEAISPTRDWCGYWEITRDNRPAREDYRSDQDFWYNLPANFDVICACYRQYLWTGDKSYLEPPFLDFYRHSLSDYIERWDRDGDGIPDQTTSERFRGIPTYVEDFRRPVREGADLVGTEYGAYLAYAAMAADRNNPTEASLYKEKAERLRRQFNAVWWDTKEGKYFLGKLPDGTFRHDLSESIGNSEAEFILICELPDTPEKISAALNQLLGNKQAQNLSPAQMGGVEGRSYLPSILYQYGEIELAYRKLAEMWDQGLARREYPEVSFTVVGTILTGLIGILPLAEPHTFETFSGLPSGTEWLEAEGISIFGNVVGVKQTGRFKTQLRNSSGPGLIWRASFPGGHKRILVDGVSKHARVGQRLNGVEESYALVPVPPGSSRVVEVEQQ